VIYGKWSVQASKQASKQTYTRAGAIKSRWCGARSGSPQISHLYAYIHIHERATVIQLGLCLVFWTPTTKLSWGLVPNCHGVLIMMLRISPVSGHPYLIVFPLPSSIHPSLPPSSPPSLLHSLSPFPLPQLHTSNGHHDQPQSSHPLHWSHRDRQECVCKGQADEWSGQRCLPAPGRQLLCTNQSWSS